MSRTRIGLVVLLSLFLSSDEMRAQSTAPAKAQTGTAQAVISPQKAFEAGEAALREGRLDAAERSFRQVLTVDPKAAGAYANLGVIRMRRKQWSEALAMLRKGEKLAPNIAGIRLNIGLAYFRQSRQALTLDPRLLGAHMGLAKIEEHRQHYPAALAELDEIVRLDKGGSDSLVLVCDCGRLDGCKSLLCTFRISYHRNSVELTKLSTLLPGLLPAESAFAFCPPTI